MARSFLHTVAGLFRKRRRTPEEFKTLFDRFKQVLESNNRALESITDIGEKLGGDYLFDIIYVRRAYEELKKNMETSLHAFQDLAHGSYPALRGVFGHLDSLIENALSDSSPLEGRLVLPLNELPWGAAKAAGGKMAHLAELRNQAGISVPDGFVITTTAYDRFLAHNGLELLNRSLYGDPSGDAAAELRDRILQGCLPPDLTAAIDHALGRIVGSRGGVMLSLRSSAEEEDGERSFAGQFRTVLNVPADAVLVGRAYREVIASLFEAKAMAYQEQHGYAPGTIRMAVGCMLMVDAAESGVVYSTAPDGGPDTMMIIGAPGLGEMVVDGGTDPDLFLVKKGPQHAVVETRIGRKEIAVRTAPQGGTVEEQAPGFGASAACLTPAQLDMLAHEGVRIERYFGCPQDIEWAIDNAGTLWILQARPLPVRAGQSAQALPAVPEGHAVIARGGMTVQEGTVSGKVFVVKRPSDIMNMPRGAILVAPHDSSLYVRSMPFVSAIVTETGSPASHMAALCRELKVPAVAGLSHATRILSHGQEITLAAVYGGAVIYQGTVPGLAVPEGKNDEPRMDDLYEFRRKRTILRYLSPLHLIDPLMDEFTPERCRSLHDMLRFMHEKAVAELVEAGRSGCAGQGKAAISLDLPIPAGMLVLDMGGGLVPSSPERSAWFERITSVPFKAIVAGMLRPGAWHADAVSIGAGDLLSSMLRMPDITTAATSTTGYNIAVISGEYVNMSIRFGYHFNMIDCFCSGNPKDNHIYFRFSGGATDLVKRSRRLDLIGQVLVEQGYGVTIKGDLLIARLAGLRREELVAVLEQTGALIAYARQLDAVLRDDQDVDRLARKFLDGNYLLGQA